MPATWRESNGTVLRYAVMPHVHETVHSTGTHIANYSQGRAGSIEVAPVVLVGAIQTGIHIF